MKPMTIALKLPNNNNEKKKKKKNDTTNKMCFLYRPEDETEEKERANNIMEKECWRI